MLFSPYGKLIFWIISHSQTLSIVSVLVPLLSISAMLVFYAVRRRATLSPVLFPAIPLALSCIPIQLIAESERILEMFRGFSTGSRAGLLPILELLIKSRYALLSRIIEAAFLVVSAILIEWYQGKKQPITLRTDDERASIAWLTVGCVGVIAAIMFAVQLCNDLVRLLSMITFRSRNAEAEMFLAKAERIAGHMGLPEISGILTTSILLLASVSIMLTILSVVMGFRCLEPRNRSSFDVAVCRTLASLVLFGCAVGAVDIFKDIRAFTFENAGAATPKVIPPSPSMLPFIMADPIAHWFSTPPPPNIDDVVVPPPPPPPPPPPG